MIAHVVARVAASLVVALPVAAQSHLPGFRSSPWFDEQVLLLEPADGVRASLHAFGPFDPERPTRVVLYATPNGSTLEHTLGARTSPGIDWRFDIQHVAAQTRRVRELTADENVVLACVQATGLSWPAWRAARGGGDAGVRAIVRRLLDEIPGADERVTLCAHSGGGSFVWGFLEHDDPIPATVERIALLDANYSFSREKGHDTKLLDWLETPPHRLVVLAYDDREVMFEGKRVVGPTGGTFRATQRMFDAFGGALELEVETRGAFEVTRATGGRFVAYRHRNPKNLILHTALVGDMNGLIHVLTLGADDEESWGRFGGPRAYDAWIQAEPGTGWDEPGARPFAPRSADALGGRTVLAKLTTATLAEREERLLAEIERGNVPAVLRGTVEVALRARTKDEVEHVVVVEVLPDYLAVGSAGDFVRVPLTPASAQRVANRHGFVLPTTKLVDAIHASAEVHLAPHPLTEERESAATFVVHDDAIVRALADDQRGRSISGIKKDIVITPRLAGRRDRVAIYGWHREDGSPIQPLYVGHVASYVDYSHGVRLVRRTVRVDGREMDIADVLADSELHVLLSDEGPIQRALQSY